MDHWTMYIKILHYFKYLHNCLPIEHISDTIKTGEHNQFNSQLINTLAIYMSVNVYIKFHRIKNIMTYLIKLLYIGECDTKLDYTDNNYKITEIIVHNQKYEMHIVHACLDSKNFLKFMFLCLSTYYCL